MLLTETRKRPILTQTEQNFLNAIKTIFLIIKIVVKIINIK